MYPVLEGGENPKMSSSSSLSSSKRLSPPTGFGLLGFSEEDDEEDSDIFDQLNK